MTRPLPVRDPQGQIVAWFGATTDIDDRKQLEDDRDLLLREVAHRLRNAFTVVRALAVQTLRRSPDLVSFEAAFLGRLDLLARLSDLPGDANQTAVDLCEIVEATLEPYRQTRNLHLDGHGLMVPARLGRQLGLALHELATNAAKYGAFSSGGGQVELVWVASGQPSDRRLVLTWTERDGPIVASAARHGFGCTLIRRSVESVGGTVALDFEPSGARCRIELPLGAETMPAVAA